MSKLKEMLKSKSVLHYIAYAALLIGLITDIVFIAIDYGDYTFTIGCFVCILVGSLVGLVDFFLDYGGFCLLASSLLYSVGIGFHLFTTLQSASDLWNGVNFIGGNQTVAIAFAIVFLVLDILLVVLNFFGMKRKSAK